MRLRSILIGFICFTASLLAGCFRVNSSQPNIIIVAVEGLGLESVPCSDDLTEATGGFNRLCAESIRFTHAYTPSLMSQATLASLVTGLYPIEHGLLHNGVQYLSEEFITLPEVALEKGYRTSFFSGGPPIWRKSGIDQGFELFEDNIPIFYSRLYRPAAKNFNLFLDWVNKEVSREPFLSFIFLADLQFPMIQTQSDLGVSRSLTRESQIQEIDESLDALILDLKKKNVWNSTYFILVGLNGKIENQNRGQPRGLNLKSENTQVVFMVKPARLKREESVQWSISSNVTLVDLGLTLFEVLGASPLQKSKLNVVSLSSTFDRPTVNWEKSRILLTESNWPVWRDISGPTYSQRIDQFLYLHLIKPKLFNSLIDRTESAPLPFGDLTSRHIYEKIYKFNQDYQLYPWSFTADLSFDKADLGAHLFAQSSVSEDVLLRLALLSKKNPWDMQIQGWLAKSYIQEKDWDSLIGLAEEVKNFDLFFLASKQKSLSTSDLKISPCFSAILKKENRVEDCADQVSRAFLNWVVSPRKKRDLNEERFLRIYSTYKLEEQLSQANYINGLFWDAALDLPQGLLPAEIALLLPEYESYKQSVDKYLGRISKTDQM